MRLVWNDAYARGYAKGAASVSGWAVARGFLYGLVMVLLAGVAAVVFAADEIPRQANEYRRDLTRLSRSVWGLDAPISTLAAQLHQESLWNPLARSQAGAQGLAQFMPATASWMSKRYPGFGNMPFDPRWALRFQSLYMKDLYDDNEGADSCERMAFALASYNGGQGHINRRKEMSATPEYCLEQTCAIRPPGVSAGNQRENERYPKRILLELTPLYYQALWGPGFCLSRSWS